MTLAAHNFDISKTKFRYMSQITNNSLFVFFLFQVRLLKLYKLVSTCGGRVNVFVMTVSNMQIADHNNGVDNHVNLATA